MLVPAATLARMASVPEWLRVPSPRFWMRCGSSTNGERPIQGTPSAPIGVGGSRCMSALRASKYMMPWHPTPPPTRAPAGATVERLWGQPLQYPGARPGRSSRGSSRRGAAVRAGEPADDGARAGRTRSSAARIAWASSSPTLGNSGRRSASRLPTTGTRLPASWRMLRAWVSTNGRFSSTTRISSTVAAGVVVDAAHPVGDRSDDLEAHPAAGVARQPEGVDAEVEHLLLVAGIEHRHAGVLEGVLAVAVQGRRLGARIVAAEQHHPTVGSGTHGVAVLQRVARAVEARRLAVPDPGHAVDAVGVCDGGTHLAAPHGGSRQLLVEAGAVDDAVLVERGARPVEGEVERPERGARVARHHRGGVQALALVEPVAQHQQARQRVDPRADRRRRRGGGRPPAR